MAKAKINGLLLESIMIRKGYRSRKNFAEALGVYASTVGDLLNEKRSPSHELINTIYKVLELTPEEAAEIFFSE